MEPLREKGIIPINTGGLGNQMFVVAAAYITSKHINCPLYLLKNNDYHHNTHKNNYRDTIFNFFGIHIDEDQKNKEYVSFLKMNGYIEDTFQLKDAYKKWDPNQYSAGYIFSKLYQYYKPFHEYKTELTDLFINGLKTYREELKLSINHSKCAFLHIRRGDYLQYVDNPVVSFAILNEEWYANAINLLIEKNKNIQKIYILTNDYEWVKSKPIFNTSLFELYTNTNELYAMALMSLCTGGAIIANSTFSWWGAFLGANTVNNPIIAPSLWTSFEVDGIIPAHWFSLPNMMK